MERSEASRTVGRMENGAASVENSMVVSPTLKNRTTRDSAISLLGTHPKELKAGY